MMIDSCCSCCFMTALITVRQIILMISSFVLGRQFWGLGALLIRASGPDSLIRSPDPLGFRKLGRPYHQRKSWYTQWPREAGEVLAGLRFHCGELHCLQSFAYALCSMCYPKTMPFKDLEPQTSNVGCWDSLPNFTVLSIKAIFMCICIYIYTHIFILTPYLGTLDAVGLGQAAVYPRSYAPTRLDLCGLLGRVEIHLYLGLLALSWLGLLVRVYVYTCTCLSIYVYISMYGIYM